jgi:putative transposase
VIEAEKAIYRVKRMCALLDVSRSGFYKWRKARAGGPSPAAQRRVELDVDAKVAAFHNASDGVYGAPRILADLTNLNPARVWGTFPGHERGLQLGHGH